MGTLRASSSVRAVRVVAGAIVVLGITTSVVACRDVVTDDVVDVSSTLCDTLAACGLAVGCDPVGRYFDEASPTEVDDFLRYFGDVGCEEGCGLAPLCLDYPNICERPAPDGPCTTDAQCCGATTGEGQCDLDAGRCCRGLGVPCQEDAECCAVDGKPVTCTEEGAVEDGEQPQRTCGGLPACGLFQQGCRSGADCCSGACVDGSCGRVTCVETGAKCQSGDECCEEGQSCREGICQGPPPNVCDPPEARANLCCAPEGGECSPPGSGGSALACCGSEAACLATPDGTTVCSPTGCVPTGALCLFDEQCCPGEGSINAACLLVAGTGGLRICQDLACEPDIGDPCDGNCCAGLSCGEDGTCEQACEATDCHPPQQVGAAIDAEQCRARGEEDRAICAEQICEEDPFCCCFQWDAGCVERASAIPACAL